LPEVGSAKSILEKFKQIETTPKSYKKETTPPGARIAGKVEYVSEPAPPMDVPVQKVEGGIFENQPMVEEDVVHSYDAQEETLPEKGSAGSFSYSPPSASAISSWTDFFLSVTTSSFLFDSSLLLMDDI
jgi:hypothetical protein